MSIDQINFIFEAAGCIAIWSNFKRLWNDRQVQGINPSSMFFYTVWAGWSAVYYYSLGHWFSLSGQSVMLAGYISWDILYMYARGVSRASAKVD